MQRNNNSEVTFLVEDIEAVLDMNRLLEKENQELKREVGRLKSQITALKAHDLERKSLLWKKFQHPTPNTQNKEHQILQKKNSHQTTEKLQPPAYECNNLSPPPPPTPPCKDPSPPPPPPLPSKLLLKSDVAVRRVPEVIEFYRFLNKKNAQKSENRANGLSGTSKEVINPKNMIGEIENRSMYLSAIKSDVETQRELINNLIREVNTAVLEDISAVETFVKWLDGELSCLVDERAVLKHFPEWPERKADALREAACCFRDLKSLESQVLSYKDSPKQQQPLSQTLTRIQTLQDRLERAVQNIDNMRDGACKRYKELQIPWEWMLDTGFLGQIKLHSLRLAREYMKRIIKELESHKISTSEDIIHQGARFAYRAHQFAGGFDLDTKQVFDELKRVHCATLNLVQACKAEDM